MALLWMDGFEGYGDTDAQEVSATLARRYAIGTENRIYVHDTGRFGSWSLNLGYSSNASILTPSLTTDDTLILGFAIKFEGEIENSYFCRLYSDGTPSINFEFDESGRLFVLRSSTVIAESVEPVIKIGRWTYLEIKIVTDNSSGIVIVKADSNTVISESGLDTQYNLAYHDQVKFQGNGSSQNDTPRIDDFYILDSTGAAYNDFLGQRRIIALVPDGDTATKQWTTSTGTDHYVLVDDLDPDDDTTYVESSTTGYQDIFTYENTTEFDEELDAVNLITDVKVTDATPYDLITVVKSGGTEYDSSADTIGSSDYTMISRLMTEDPDTSSSWTLNGVNNVEMGIEVG